MKLTKSMKLASAVGAGTIIVGSAGVAVAMWSATGSGSGSATAYTAQAITATAVGSPTAATNLYPGGSAVAVQFTTANPNPYPVSFSGWSNGLVTAVTGGAGSCATTDFTFPATGTASNTAAALATAATGSLPAALSMNSTALDGCQGAKVTVTFTLTGGTQTT